MWWLVLVLVAACGLLCWLIIRAGDGWEPGVDEAWADNARLFRPDGSHDRLSLEPEQRERLDRKFRDIAGREAGRA